MFAYLLLLHDPNPCALLCVEEPENQLYPEMLDVLAEDFRAYSNQGQIFISTHSPDFLNAVAPEEVIVLEKEKGFTVARKLSEDKEVRSLFEGGDKLGWLWKQGFFTKSRWS